MKTSLTRSLPLLVLAALALALLPGCPKKKAALPEPSSASVAEQGSGDDGSSGEGWNEGGEGDSEYSDESGGEGKLETGGDDGNDAGYAEGEEGGGPAYEESPALTGTFIIRAGVGLYERDGGAMKWKDSLGLGQTVDVTGAPVKGKVEKDANEYSFLPVKLESGSEGYVIDQFVAEDATLGAVTSELGTLYKSAKETAVTATILPVMNVVATFPVQGKPEFYKVLCFDALSGARYSDRFMDSSDVSIRGDDVNVALLMAAIKNVPKKEQKKKMLNTILAKYPASAFSGKVQELQIALDPDKMGKVPMAGSYVATDSGTIRDIPSVYGAAVGKLSKGDEVTAAEATSEKFTIAEDTAPWIRVTAPAAGWVFGDLLAEKR